MDERNVNDNPDEVGINSAELGDALCYWLDPKKQVPSVVSISGAWGSGKTYWWTHYIPTIQSRNVYVSLFGVADTQELEQRLLAASFGIEDGTTEKRVAKGLQSLGKLAKIGAEAFKDIPGAGIMGGLEGYLGSVVRDAAYGRLENAVIAIDDLERKSSTLKLEQVLGFVARLHEVWKAAVVLILNESRLSSDDQTLLNDFREKVIDCDFRFTATAASAAKIGLEGHTWAVQSAADFGERVNLSNIRIYQRASSVLARLPIHYSTLPPSVQSRLATSVIALCWAQFASGPEVPSLDQLLSFHSMSFAVAGIADKTRKSLPHEKTLSKLSWSADEMDNLIAIVVRTGKVPTDAIATQLNAYLMDEARARAHERISAIWTLYRSTLNGDDEALANHIVSTFSECKQYVSVGDVSSAAWLLRALAKSDDANAMIDTQTMFWEQRGDSLRARSVDLLGDTDKYLLEKLQERPAQSPYKTIGDLFEFFVKHNDGWNPEEEAALLAYTARDWLNFLGEAKHERFMVALSRIRDVYSLLRGRHKSVVQWRVSPLDVALRALRNKTKMNAKLIPALMKST